MDHYQNWSRIPDAASVSFPLQAMSIIKLKIIPVKQFQYFLLCCLCLTISVRAQSVDSLQLVELNDLSYIDSPSTKNDSLQQLNLIVPESASNIPLLIWIGGGAWAYGDRHAEMDLARMFAREGMAVASLSHRMSPAIWRDPELSDGVQHPAHVQDIAAAFKWLYDHADMYGYDQDQVFIGGYSSGGHLAALLSMDAKYLKEVGLERQHIKGVIPIAGAYDIANYHEAFLNGSRPELAKLHVEAVFGNTEAKWLDASPTSYAESITVPMLLISERNSFNYTRILEEKIRAVEFSDFEVIHVREMGHGDFWKHLSQAETSPYREAILAFIRSHNTIG